MLRPDNRPYRGDRVFSPSRSFILVGFAAGLLAWAASTASAHTYAPSVRASAAMSASSCGNSVRRLADSARGRVNFTAASSTVDALAAKSRSGVSSGRDAFERQAYTVTAQVVKFRADSAGLHFVLFHGSSYMQAYLPSPSCLPSYARARSTMVATRKWFLKNCGQASSSWKPLGAEVRVTGVAYWGSTNVSGGAPNGAELAPVYGMNPVAGCGAAGG
jgi:hypothetical protein